MKTPAFAYARPDSLAEALTLLSEHDDAKILAGGQSLLPVMALRLGSPELVVDIGNLDELRGISLTADGSVRIGALATHAQVEDSAVIRERAPLFHAAAPFIGHRAIRNRGTAVGSIAHGDPAAELPAVCLAVEAVMEIASATGTREVAARDFFTGFLDTSVEEHEILVAVRVPPIDPQARCAVVEVARRHGDYALVGAVVQISVGANGLITNAALAYLGVASTPLRIAEAEHALIGRPANGDSFAAAADIVSASIEPAADVHATTNYRKHLAGVLTRRALTQAVNPAGVTK